MLEHPQFNPIALDLGFIKIHWYGLMYLLGFGVCFWLTARRTAQAPFAQRGWTRRDVEDLLFFIIVGVIVGGRLGYVLFYKPGHYLEHPLEIFAVWKGGMSFHGGLLGVIAAEAVFSVTRKRQLFEVADLVAPSVPAALAAGRLGNFINGELWGRAADPSLPWAMVFPQSGSPVPRHPSPLYQMALEGLLLLAVMAWYARRPSAHARREGGFAWGRVSGLFLMGYGVLRFAAEYFREPDSFLGLLALNLSMGQWLCVPMVVAGAVFWAMAGRWPPQRS